MKEKNTHPPLYGVIEFVCLSLTNFDLNYLRTGEIEWAEIFFSLLSCILMQLVYCLLRKILITHYQSMHISYANSRMHALYILP